MSVFGDEYAMHRRNKTVLFFSRFSVLKKDKTSLSPPFVKTEKNIVATKDLQNKGLIIELQSCVTAFLSQKFSGKTCFITQPGTSINFRLTNRLRRFEMTSIIEKDSSDNLAFLFILFKTTFKNMNHRNYKKFHPIAFLYNLGQEILKGEMYNSNEDMYSTFTS